jgi:hypothetical protein
MSEQPWYKEGLRFQCTQCGDCCTGATGFVWVNKAEMEALAEHVGVTLEEFEKKHVRRFGIRNSLVELPNDDCVFFDGKTRRCTVYQARPRQCRTWPFWNSNVRDKEAWKETCQVCPGSGKGPLIPLKRIARQVELIRV